MKTIILAAIAATFATNVHANEPTFAESCGHLDNPTRFNPTELSEYQECWLGFHKPDEMAGVLGNIFWARAGDMTVSMPVSELTNAGSKSAATAIVVDRIVEVVNNERIEELEGVVAGLEATVSEKEAAIRALEMLRDSQAGTITGLNTQISTLEDEKAALETASAALQATIDGHPAVVRAAEEAARMAGVASVTVRAGNVSASWTAETVTIALSNGSSYEYSIAQGASVYRAEGRGDILSQIRDTDNTRTEGVSARLDLNGNITIDFEAGYGLMTDNDAAAISAARDAVDTTAFDGMSGTAIRDGQGMDHTFDNSAGDSYDVGNYNHTFRTEINDGGFPVTYDVVSFDLDGVTITREHVTFSTAIEWAIEAVVEATYDAGYDDGYADGYRDGFADGVASVQ